MEEIAVKGEKEEEKEEKEEEEEKEEGGDDFEVDESSIFLDGADWTVYLSLLISRWWDNNSATWR